MQKLQTRGKGIITEKGGVKKRRKKGDKKLVYIRHNVEFRGV